LAAGVNRVFIIRNAPGVTAAIATEARNVTAIAAACSIEEPTVSAPAKKSRSSHKSTRQAAKLGSASF